MHIHLRRVLLTDEKWGMYLGHLPLPRVNVPALPDHSSSRLHDLAGLEYKYDNYLILYRESSPHYWNKVSNSSKKNIQIFLGRTSMHGLQIWFVLLKLESTV